MRDLGALWHFLVGASVTTAALLIGVPGWVALPTLSAFGFLREVMQHDWSLTLRQHVEAWSWGVGSGVAWMIAWWMT